MKVPNFVVILQEKKSCQMDKIFLMRLCKNDVSSNVLNIYIRVFVQNFKRY